MFFLYLCQCAKVCHILLNIFCYLDVRLVGDDAESRSESYTCIYVLLYIFIYIFCWLKDAVPIKTPA